MLAVVQFKTYLLSLNDKNLKIKIYNTILIAVFRRIPKIAKSDYFQVSLRSDNNNGYLT